MKTFEKKRFNLILNYKSGTQKIFQQKDTYEKVLELFNKIKNKSNICHAYVETVFYNQNNQPYKSSAGYNLR